MDVLCWCRCCQLFFLRPLSCALTSNGEAADEYSFIPCMLARTSFAKLLSSALLPMPPAASMTSDERVAPPLPVLRALAALMSAVSSSFRPASGTSSISSRSAMTAWELPLLPLALLLRLWLTLAISLNSDDVGSS